MPPPPPPPLLSGRRGGATLLGLRRPAEDRRRLGWSSFLLHYEAPAEEPHSRRPNPSPTAPPMPPYLRSAGSPPRASPISTACVAIPWRSCCGSSTSPPLRRSGVGGCWYSLQRQPPGQAHLCITATSKSARGGGGAEHQRVMGNVGKHSANPRPGHELDDLNGDVVQPPCTSRCLTPWTRRMTGAASQDDDLDIDSPHKVKMKQSFLRDQNGVLVFLGPSSLFQE